MEKKSVIDKIRKDKGKKTKNRRKIAALAALGLLDFSLISLFQMGYIKKLPDLPGQLFDTEKVNTSKDAVLMGLPDGVISLGAYTLTMALAVAGMRLKKKKSRYADIALGAVVAGQAAGAANYMWNMSFVQKKVCLYCVAGAAINFAALKPTYKLLKSSLHS